jgi:hypothetical protein
LQPFRSAPSAAFQARRFVVLFVFLLSAALIGHAEFVDHVLPLRSAVARAIYQTAELSDRPRVRLNHTHNEHP